MSNSQDKSSNGLGSDPLQRLASFKPPRDLSLGGVKPNKKVFTPNLNVTRSRNKGVPLANSRDHKKNDKDKRDRIDKELEEQKIKSVVGGDDGLDEEVEDFKQSFEIDAPIKLPIDDGWLYSQPKPTVKIKQEVVVKTEPTEYADCPILLFIILQPSDGGEESCVLSGLQEGRIGRLQVRRSGRVTLLLGDTVFEVCPGTKAAFHQEAVSVSVEDAARSARLVSLGPLQHKLTLLPDWQTMFTDMTL
ncbi:DNA-directed RNA polymerase III subunit RPC4 [Papilio machaon]|uniref:DNA-directed RNA polymerase III subunit RPC4 n=1 Tax=Papilio machaon TaxID=76193 RepID=A0A194RE13_PAPMA|nr:DNA-directed RNA polymerase III subunit RPC4 [Papilio machaon]